MRLKVKFKSFVFEQEAADFATLVQEQLINISWDGNNPEKPWVVWYKDVR